jgi:hypothetical protein
VFWRHVSRYFHPQSGLPLILDAIWIHLEDLLQTMKQEGCKSLSQVASAPVYLVPLASIQCIDSTDVYCLLHIYNLRGSVSRLSLIGISTTLEEHPSLHWFHNACSSLWV